MVKLTLNALPGRWTPCLHLPQQHIVLTQIGQLMSMFIQRSHNNQTMNIHKMAHNCLIGAYLSFLFASTFASKAMGVTLFEKQLENGHSVRVERETKITKPNAPHSSPAKTLPPGAIVVVSDVEITECSVIINDGKGLEKTVWRKRSVTDPYLAENSDNITTLKVVDIAEKNGFLAILYSAEKIEIDVIDLNAEEGHNILAHESLFRNSCLAILKQGKLVWLDKLYVILEFDPEATEVFCIDKGKCKKLFTDSKIEYSK